MPSVKLSTLSIIHLTLNKWNVSNQNVFLNFFLTFSKWWGIECTSSQSVSFFQAKRSHCISSSRVLGTGSLYFVTSTIIHMVHITRVGRPVVLYYKVCKFFWNNCMKCAPRFSLQGFPTFVGHISPRRCARNFNRGRKHQQRVRVRERLQAVLVLEVVFSAFYVSDDTEFEFIENKIMGFRMRQIWVEVALPQQFRKHKMTLKNVQGPGPPYFKTKMAEKNFFETAPSSSLIWRSGSATVSHIFGTSSVIMLTGEARRAKYLSRLLVFIFTVLTVSRFLVRWMCNKYVMSSSSSCHC